MYNEIYNDFRQIMHCNVLHSANCVAESSSREESCAPKQVLVSCAATLFRCHVIVLEEARFLAPYPKAPEPKRGRQGVKRRRKVESGFSFPGH